MWKNPYHDPGTITLEHSLSEIIFKMTWTLCSDSMTYNSIANHNQFRHNKCGH